MERRRTVPSRLTDVVWTITGLVAWRGDPGLTHGDGRSRLTDVADTTD
jgi:hypothetical protein